MRRLVLSVLMSGAACVATATERADWYFCYGSDDASHKGYLTQIFESAGDRAPLETAMRSNLQAQGRPVENVECPAPTSAPIAMRRRDAAERFMPLLGYRLTDLK